MWTRNNWVVSRFLFRYLIDGVDHHDLAIFMMALPFRALSRLVGAASKPVTTGLNSEVARQFGTTALRQVPRTDMENKKRSIYYMVWKRKWMWIMLFTGIGAIIYDLRHPDRVERTEKLYKGWNNLTTNVYSPNKPQPEAKPEATRDWASLHWGSI